ncbi:hypothetical protein [Streptomyces sp. NRRL F-4428]|uniref:hypothetical protein n=1 Tax=Streptomyces sp. NRRL F-4428 TaxID=1609137 RepID=UPI0006985B40|nr:hypothetical protein [Streptomyces sp. NRRL F-4428]
MAMRPPGSNNTVKRRYAGAIAAVTTVLMLAACDPSATGAGAVTPSASASAAVSPSPSASPTPSTSPTPSADPTTAAPTAPPATQAAPAATEPAPAPPAPARTRTTAPAPAPTKAEEDTACHPLSNAGNCYKAGQICRKADIGSSGRDANGRAIHCRKDSSVGQRWGY